MDGIVQYDLPSWTPEQRSDFFSRALYGSVGYEEPWLVSGLLFDPDNETEWNGRHGDAPRIAPPSPGLLPDWRTVWLRIRDRDGGQGLEKALAFDVFHRWRLGLVPSKRGMELVLARRDGSWESRWETLLSAENGPDIQNIRPDGRIVMEYGNLVYVRTNGCYAMVFGIRPAMHPETYPGYDPASGEIPYELCMPPLSVVGVEFEPPNPAEETHAESAESESHAEDTEGAE